MEKIIAVPVSNEYTIPHANMAALGERVAALNKRARRNKWPEITLDITATETRYRVTRSGGGYGWTDEPDHKNADGVAMRWHTVRVTGSTPKYNGWEFIATLEPITTDHGQCNMVYTVPGKKCPGEFAAPGSVGVCDHCGTRRDRKHTFVVYNAERGEYARVGRSCLMDFLGHNVGLLVVRLARWAEWLGALSGDCERFADDEHEGGSKCAGPPCYALGYFLGWVAGVMRVHGWLGRTKARKLDGPSATVDRVLHLLEPPRVTGPYARDIMRAWEEERDMCRPTEADKQLAADTVAWAAGLDLAHLRGSDNTYMTNLANLAAHGIVTPRAQGIAASMVATYGREMGKEVAEGDTFRPESRHVGDIGKRDQYRVRVESVMPREGHYGTTYITKMFVWDEDRECYANEAVWFASKDHDMEPGTEHLVRATVRDHGKYNGRAQTTLARVS